MGRKAVETHLNLIFPVDLLEGIKDPVEYIIYALCSLINLETLRLNKLFKVLLCKILNRHPILLMCGRRCKHRVGNWATGYQTFADKSTSKKFESTS